MCVATHTHTHKHTHTHTQRRRPVCPNAERIRSNEGGAAHPYTLSVAPHPSHTQHIYMYLPTQSVNTRGYYMMYFGSVTCTVVTTLRSLIAQPSSRVAGWHPSPEASSCSPHRGHHQHSVSEGNAETHKQTDYTNNKNE
eukprot:GHVU01148698.1.p1 GENE.GHVU01148698.1~~GHVU01148698.1.p1  ORF type:complete len:139 (-),score=6.57 GHVU01148698.1:515-931(-)